MIVFVSDAFAEQYGGGAELTTQSLIDTCLLPSAKIKSSDITLQDMMNTPKDAFWVFGNYYNLNPHCMLYAIRNLNYCILEYDYKYCKYRSPEKHYLAEGKCDCSANSRGKLISLFMKSSKINWFMSHEQMEIYHKIFPFLADSNDSVLSSVFDRETLEYIYLLDCENKNNKWIICGSDSWIKGKEDAIEYAEENNLEYEIVWGLGYREMLQKLSQSRGLIFLPRAGDTCPRMVIEAALMNCELILNENVQHKKEEWFKTPNSIHEYLKDRTKVFWNTLEDLWHIPTPKLTEEDNDVDLMFHIVVPFYNVEDWIHRCIHSISRQRHKNFKCYLIDDMSTDSSFKVAANAIGDDQRFVLVKNGSKQHALGNIVNTINSFDGIASVIGRENTLNWPANPDDVVIILDGDDWLASSCTLSYLNNLYNNEDCYVTYGSYVLYPFGIRGPEPSPYGQKVIEDNAYRQDKWRASHLRTFKYDLWSKINLEDLKDENTGEYFEVAYDQALMLPLIEMASERTKYVDEYLSVYNRATPNNVDKSRPFMQISAAKQIRNRKPYERID